MQFLIICDIGKNRYGMAASDMSISRYDTFGRDETFTNLAMSKILWFSTAKISYHLLIEMQRMKNGQN